ncbi:unnamed protein product [Fraxinus pennsylvanica]|uniref:Cytochrome P450 n=1 Tax=Fraxinus pennsylvanica TaxID=56036 RepID=A0AAD1ZJ39_9LAMI|nr:unnamed protein product [Fraxinus pennsylvanica]
MGSNEFESLWLFAIASKCKSFTYINSITFAFLLLLAWLCMNLIFWAHPGGPAWGKYKWRKLTGTKPIPGPNGIPIIGSMKLMMGLAHHKLAAMAEFCKAKRLMAFSLGETRVIVTCNPDVAKEILNSSTFADRPTKESAYNLMFNRAIGFATYGVYWRSLRRISAAHLFCPKQIKASEFQRSEIANQLVAMFRAEKGEIWARDALKRASLSNMMCSVFGKNYKLDSYNYETNELQKLVDEGYDLLGTTNWSDHLPCLSDFDIQKIRLRCFNLVPKVNQFVGRIIEEHKAESGELGRDFVDVLLSLQGPDRLSESDMIAVLWEMIFRGTDTVAVLIEWILARLMLRPDIQSKVHSELDKVVGSSRAVTETDLVELVYLAAVIKEVLRLHPPGPLLSWARLAITDSVIDGYRVPAGTTAMVNMLAPFGSGRRSCPGKTLALTTVTFWIASLLHEFEFEPCGQVDLSEVLRLSCEMANPLMVRVRSK